MVLIGCPQDWLGFFYLLRKKTPLFAGKRLWRYFIYWTYLANSKYSWNYLPMYNLVLASLNCWNIYFHFETLFLVMYTCGQNSFKIYFYSYFKLSLRVQSATSDINILSAATLMKRGREQCLFQKCFGEFHSPYMIACS